MNPFDDREEYDLFMDLFADLMRAVTSGELQAALECGEAVAGLESREKQKAFCNFAGECIRKIFMVQQKMPQIAGIADQEQEFYADMAGRCGKGFCMRTITNIEKVVAMIDREVNPLLVVASVGKYLMMRLFNSFRLLSASA